MTESWQYGAFISYRHVEPDRRWAHWLHRSLEAFRTPRALVRAGVPARVGRVFRDEEELPASADLSREIDRALEQSRFLVVVCSPSTPASRWVNKEVQRFRELQRGDRIIALLVHGEPHEAFPPSLRQIRRLADAPGGPSAADVEEVEPLAADVRRSRLEPRSRLRKMALLRIAACLLGCRFDDLRQREQERQRRRLLAGLAGLVVLAAAFATLTLLLLAERGAKEQQLALARSERDLLRRATQSRWLLDRHAGLTWPSTATAEEAAEWRGRVEGLLADRTALVAERAALEAAGARDDDPKRTWRVETIRAVEADLRRLEPLLPEIASRERRARAEAQVAQDPAWSVARDRIRRAAVYGGLDLPVQGGLVPLGVERVSGLHEFAVQGTGDVPAWDAAEDRAIVTERSAIVLVLLPGGTFVQGSQRAGDPEADPVEEPAHTVRVPPFFLGKHEVTRAQWTAIGGGPGSDARSLGGAHPATGMSWVEARRVLEAGSYALRLPTESEWELACRGGSTLPYGVARTADELRAHAHFGAGRPDDGPRTALAGSRGAGYGLHDLQGNVAEWCEDAYEPGYEDAPVDGSARPPGDDPKRVVRGGDFRSPARAMRPASRGWELRDRGHPDLGLRVARSVGGLR